MPPKNSEEYVREYIESFGCKLLSSYKTNVTKLKIEYPCGHIDKNKTFSNFRAVQNKICSKCGDDKFSIEYVRKYIENMDCELISKRYSGNLKPLKIKFSCGHIWSRTFAKFKDRKSKVCAKCSGNQKISLSEIKRELKSRGYKLLDNEYKNANIRMNVENKDGYRYYLTLSSFRSCSRRDDSSHPILSKYNHHSLYDVSVWLKLNKKTFVIGENKPYKTAKTKLNFICSICNNKFSSVWDSICHGTGCPHCSESSGEKKIRLTLKKFKVKNIPQHPFENCRDRNKLKFDFYIARKNLCVEYQGQQHFFPVDFAGRGEKWAKEEFKKNKKRDQIKRDFCKQNGIKLIEIPYWEFNNIEQILSKELGL